MDPGFTYWHWAGVGPCTKPYGLAGTCVFDKQSASPCHCDPKSLLGSRSLEGHDHLVKISGTPSPEVTGPVCRVPLGPFPPNALAYSARDTCVGSRYGRRGSFQLPFSWRPGLGRTHIRGPFPGLTWFSPLRYSPGLSGLARDQKIPGQPIPSGRRAGLRCRTYHGGRRILTPFPFGSVELRAALGPTNPPSTIVAEEPWPFRRHGFSPCFTAY